jgi:hypothetical protein
MAARSGERFVGGVCGVDIMEGRMEDNIVEPPIAESEGFPCRLKA